MEQLSPQNQTRPALLPLPFFISFIRIHGRQTCAAMVRLAWVDREEKDGSPLTFHLLLCKIGTFRKFHFCVFKLSTLCRQLILIPNRNLGFFPARIAPCFVKALDHICPLCSAGFASPDTILSRKSFPTFLLDISMRFCFLIPTAKPAAFAAGFAA